MSVRAHTANGESVLLAAHLGENPDQVIEGISRGSLTGSAAPFADVWLSTESGGAIRYSEIVRLETEPDGF